MPKKDKVGYGKYTKPKMYVLGKIYDMHLAVTQAVLKRNPRYRNIYRYYDLTAGKGYVPDSSIPGSPLVFIKSANSEKIRIPWEAHLIECESTNINELKRNIEGFNNKGPTLSNIAIHEGRYEEIIPKLLGQTNDRELGLFFVDHSGDLPDFDTIKMISQKRPRAEILIYIAARNIKRQRHLLHKTLTDFMNDIEKEFWLVRKPMPGDNLEWTFLLGSNTDIFKKYKSINFYKSDSPEAKNFLPRLDMTEKEREEQHQMRFPGFGKDDN